MSILALDVGGTKVMAGVFDAQGQRLRSVERPSCGAAGRAAVLASMRAALADLAWAGEVTALGIAAAGVIDPQRACVLDATEAIPGWAGCDFRAEFPQFKVRALNDVQAALLAELAELAAAPAPGCVVMLTLGTGLGGAIAFDGRLHGGRHALAGHFGRSQVAGVPVESVVSGTGLAALHRRLGGASLNAREVLAAADAADADATQALHEWVQALAEVLRNLHWTLDPERVLIGGGLLDARERWWPALQAALEVPLCIEPARLGTRAGLIGAAHWAAA